MAQTESLFASRLKRHRLGHGEHGRMTQEQLGEALGVSVDAISKYERSLSFIRGDLEHRLAERLGWSRSDIVACRNDWSARSNGAESGRYRLLDQGLVDEIYGGSWREASLASVDFADHVFGDLPDDLAVNSEVFTPIYAAFPSHWAVVMRGDQIVAKWAIVFLMPEDEKLFREGAFMERDLSLDRLRQPILPGRYFGYSPVVIVERGHEAASALLLSSFVSFLEDLARRDILFHGLGTISCSPGGAQLCRELGMAHLKTHRLGPDYGVWAMDGTAIAGSIFAKRSPFVARQYGREFAPPGDLAWVNGT